MSKKVAYIGTGPISVIDAVFMQKKGEGVVLIDDKPNVGGAWIAIEVGEFGKLEIGCHIWSYNKKAYDFIQQFFELNLVRLNPQPYISKGNIKLTYDRKNIITTFKHTGKLMTKLQFGSITSNFRKNPAFRIPILPKPYLYPVGGARDLEKALIKKIEAEQLETRLNTRITEMVYTNNKWLLKMEDGDDLSSEKVIMTATSSVKKVRYNDSVLEINHRKLNYTHYHLIIDGAIEQPFSYVRVLNHDIIHRISDITNQLIENEKGYQVILIGVFDDKLPNDRPKEEIVSMFTDYLKGRKMLATDSTVVYAQKNKFETSYIDPQQIKVLKEMDGLEVMATTDFMYGVYHKLNDWKE